MTNILVFGASSGGANYIKNCEENILAIVDNNLDKEGELFLGYRIISPSKISQYPYDKIVIASMYVHSIYKQLIELNVDKDKIYFAPKNRMKNNMYPFKNPIYLDKAAMLIKEMGRIFEEIPYFFTYGTLLGIARNGELIEWDDDIDIAIYEEDFEKALRLLMDNISIFNSLFDVEIKKRIYNENGRPASINIECFDGDQSLFIVNLDCMLVEGNIVRQELSDTPIKYFKAYDLVKYRDFEIRAPFNNKDYLTYSYGNWQEVRKNTSFNNNSLVFREPIYSSKEYIVYNNK